MKWYKNETERAAGMLNVFLYEDPFGGFLIGMVIGISIIGLAIFIAA